MATPPTEEQKLPPPVVPLCKGVGTFGLFRAEPTKAVSKPTSVKVALKKTTPDKAGNKVAPWQ